jgi:rhamnose transport system permease protein
MKRLTGIVAEFVGPREVVTLAILLIVVAVSSHGSPFFLSDANISFAATDAIEILLLALPLTLLVALGEIDLSVGSIVGLVVAIAAPLTAHRVPFGLVIVAMLATGVLAGLVNGLLTTRFRLPSLVVTIATLALFRGLAEVILGDQTLSGFPDWFVGWDRTYLVGLLTIPHVATLVLVIVFAVFLHRSRYGRLLLFIGANSRAAQFAGIDVARAKVLTFALTGLMSAVAAIVLMSRLQAVDNTTGVGLELAAITAVLLGGAELNGGSGKIVGTVMAVAVVALVANGLQLSGFSAQVTTAITGALLIASFVVDNAWKYAAAHLRTLSGGRAPTSQ